MRRYAVLLAVLAALLAAPSTSSAMSKTVTINGVTQTIAYQPKTGKITYYVASVWAKLVPASQAFVEVKTSSGWKRLDCPESICPVENSDPDKGVCTCFGGRLISSGSLPGGGFSATREHSFQAGWLAGKARKSRVRVRGVSDFGGLALPLRFTH